MPPNHSKFAFATPKVSAKKLDSAWNVLIVDDEESVHEITKLSLYNFEYDNKALNFTSAYSAQEAIDILERDQDFALILLDVVMETSDAGLLVAQFIRDMLQNTRIRIVIRTGEPGEVPQQEVIDNYDINDYKEKTELTNDRLYTTIRTALSQYKQISELYDSELQLRLLNTSLEQKIEEALKKQHKQQEELFEQNRAMQNSELLNMLAHQWRQPLSSIGAVVAQMKVSIAFKECNIETFNESLDHIDEYIKGLSDTITAFRDLHLPSHESERKDIPALVQQAQNLLGTISDSMGIEMKVDTSKCSKTTLYSSEVVQVILHILKNSQDELYAKNIQDPFIHIKAWDDTETSYIEITDNAGGIPNSIRDKIFDPYFSTKKEKNGTGLGLYNSVVIVREKFSGSINVRNTMDGASVIISLPKTMV